MHLMALGAFSQENQIFEYSDTLSSQSALWRSVLSDVSYAKISYQTAWLS